MPDEVLAVIPIDEIVDILANAIKSRVYVGIGIPFDSQAKTAKVFVSQSVAFNA